MQSPRWTIPDRAGGQFFMVQFSKPKGWSGLRHAAENRLSRVALQPR
jgi:hypothetical protein